MKRILIVLFVTFSLGAFAQEQEIKQRFIEVVGNSKMEVAPDIAYFSLLLIDNPKENINVEKQEVEISKILKKYGVPSENLTIDKLSGIRQKVSFWGTKDVVNRKSYLLKLTNLAVSDKIIEELSALKITSISIYSFIFIIICLCNVKFHLSCSFQHVKFLFLCVCEEILEYIKIQ